MHLESMGMTELTIHYQVGGGSPFSPPPATSPPLLPLPNLGYATVHDEV